MRHICLKVKIALITVCILSDLVVSYRATILMEHLYHDHCYIQSEKIITRNEQFIGQQNLSILKFHQSIRGLSRDKFTRGSGLVFFNEIWWKYFVWTKFFTIYVILEEMEGILLGCHLLRRPHEIKQNVSCVLSYLFFLVSLSLNQPRCPTNPSRCFLTLLILKFF